jgi:hypothetical protein
VIDRKPSRTASERAGARERTLSLAILAIADAYLERWIRLGVTPG